MLPKIVISLTIFICIAISKELKVYFLDVKEGESIVIITPSGNVNVIDTGNIATGYYVYKFLKDKNITHIDRLIVTHPHLDHMGGVFLIAQSFDVKLKHDNGQTLPLEQNSCSDVYRWYEGVFRSENYEPLKRGYSWVDDGVRFTVLWPKNLQNDWNANSLVIRVEYKKVSFLLMGDANKASERELLLLNSRLGSTVLKVGHHGAKDSLTEEFLKRVSPEYAVISIDKNNVRGYPFKGTIRLLKENNVKVFTTYENGNILFITDGENLVVKTSR